MTDSSFTAATATAPLERIARQSAHEMRDPFDIGEALTALAHAGAVFTVYAPGDAAPFLAHIASVDAQAPRFALAFPGARPAPGRATFVALLTEEARLQFELDSDWQDPANLPFPDACLVLERRTTQRADTSLVDHFTATVRLSDKHIELPLCDFATGGIGLHAPLHTAAALHVGQKLKDVQIRLGPALSIVADLEVRMLRPFRSYLLGEQVQVGCRYDRIEMEMQSRGQV